MQLLRLHRDVIRRIVSISPCPENAESVSIYLKVFTAESKVSEVSQNEGLSVKRNHDVERDRTAKDAGDLIWT